MSDTTSVGTSREPRPDLELWLSKHNGGGYSRALFEEVARYALRLEHLLMDHEWPEKRMAAEIVALRSELDAANASIAAEKARVILKNRALKFVKHWLVSLEQGVTEDDPLRAIRCRVHAPVHKAIDLALEDRENQPEPLSSGDQSRTTFRIGDKVKYTPYKGKSERARISQNARRGVVVKEGFEETSDCIPVLWNRCRFLDWPLRSNLMMADDPYPETMDRGKEKSPPEDTTASLDIQGMPMVQTQINHGGLMRCCLKTLADIPDETMVESGERRKCTWCKSYFRLEGTVWEWDREA